MRREVFFGVALVFFFIFMIAAGPGEGQAKKSRPGAARSTHQSTAKQPGSQSPGATAQATDLSPGQINARSAILMEVSTGMVLFEQNADEPIEPASFTKIATLYLVFEALKQGRIHMNDEVWISEAAWRTGGSKMFVAVHTKVSLEDLIKGVAVDSGNDACVALAEHLSGSTDTFVDAMNRKAAELGMTGTHFENPHGLPVDGQITTARDMALLDTAYLKRFPESLRFHSMKEFAYNNIVQYNRNHLLLKDSRIDGLKTGYVSAAGYHLSGTSERNGMRLVAVVMGAANPATREREVLKLLNFGFRNFALVQPFKDGQAVATAKVLKGKKDEIPVYPADKPTFLIPQSQKNLLKWEVHITPDLTAPVKANQVVGELVFTVADQPKRTVSLLSGEDVAVAGWVKRGWQLVSGLAFRLDWKWLSAILGVIAAIAITLILASGRRRKKSF
jgi:D-alanyl-D-alanine carboxypeptidase (penicillin-binding protein 5/6)